MGILAAALTKHRICAMSSVGNIICLYVYVYLGRGWLYAGSNVLLWIGSEEVEFIVVVAAV